MTCFLLIESRAVLATDEGSFCSAVARQLARDAFQVSVLLIQNGVLPARLGARSPQLANMAAAGVTLLADEFSLRERGIPTDRLAAGVRATSLAVVIDRLADGWTVIWH